MKIEVNSKEMDIPSSFTLEQLAARQQLPSQGIAMAVNNRLVPRPQWSAHFLQERDSVVIVKAACGG